MQRWGDTELGVSVMSAEELFLGCRRADTPSRHASREEFVETILAAIPVASITLAIARVFGEIDARLSAAGHRIPRSDLLIASTALTRGDQIVTGNRRHFDRVPGPGPAHWRPSSDGAIGVTLDWDCPRDYRSINGFHKFLEEILS